MLKRGRRLDETKPGSGLGLSIVSDLAALYRGTLSLDVSTLGGLRAVLELPGARIEAVLGPLGFPRDTVPPSCLTGAHAK